MSIEYMISPAVTDADLNRLFAASWQGYVSQGYAQVLSHSLVYICAFDQSSLVGFVNVAWNGGKHGFILDTTVAPDYRHRGIGTQLVRHAAIHAARAGLEWLHVDYEPHLDKFYLDCGFRPTMAGLLRLSGNGQLSTTHSRD